MIISDSLCRLVKYCHWFLLNIIQVSYWYLNTQCIFIMYHYSLKIVINRWFAVVHSINAFRVSYTLMVCLNARVIRISFNMSDIDDHYLLPMARYLHSTIGSKVIDKIYSMANYIYKTFFFRKSGEPKGADFRFLNLLNI